MIISEEGNDNNNRNNKIDNLGFVQQQEEEEQQQQQRNNDNNYFNDEDDDEDIDDVDDEENHVLVDGNNMLVTTSTTTSSSSNNNLSNTNIPRICCALLASIVTGGVTYAFGLYGVALKRTLQLTQTQLDTISSATFCAGLFSWLPGMFVDKFGTRLGICSGGITGATSLMLYWCVSTQIIFINTKSVVVTILSILGVTTFLSCALITGSVFKIISCSCGPGTKGSAVGVAKGYVGLGSGAFACLFESIRSPTSSDLDFLPMGAFLFLACATMPSYCFMETNPKPVPDVMTQFHFRILFISLFSLALVVVGTSLLTLYEQENEHTHKGDTNKNGPKPNYFMALLIIVVWIGPLIAQLFIPYKQQSQYSVLPGEQPEEEDDDEQELHDSNNDDCSFSSNSTNSHGITRRRRSGMEDGGNDSFSDHNQRPDNVVETSMDELMAGDEDRLSTGSGGSNTSQEEVQDRNLFQMLQTPMAWIMLWIATIVVGGGTVETNNMGQMVESLRFPSVVASASLALFSVAQSAGRVLTGVVSETALDWNTNRFCINKGVPRPFFLVVTSFVGVVAHTILAFSTEQRSFVFGTALAGLSFGGVWPMLVLIVGEIFGTAHVAANYMFYDGVTSAGGTFLLSKVVAQKVYENHVDHHQDHADADAVDGEAEDILLGGDHDIVGDEITTCYGQECFQATHIIISMLLTTCVVISFIFMYLTRNVYNKENLHVRH